MKKTLILLLILTRFLNAQNLGEAKTPKLFAPGIVSTDLIEAGPLTFSSDGRTAYFTVWSPDHFISVLCESNYKDSAWTEPVILPFSGKFIDEHPFLSPDGKKLFFSSARPLSEKSNIPKDHDIWCVERNGESWGKPIRLSDSINSPYGEFSPCITSDGTLFFTHYGTNGGTQGDIYYSESKGEVYSKRKRIASDSINTPLNEWHVYVSADKKYMFYTTLNKPGARGNEDLFISKRENDKWLDPIPFPFNGVDHDYCASITPNGKFLCYTSERNEFVMPKPVKDYKVLLQRSRSPMNGRGDLYYIELDVLFKMLHL